jgi:hypothetical protein
LTPFRYGFIASTSHEALFDLVPEKSYPSWCSTSIRRKNPEDPDSLSWFSPRSIMLLADLFFFPPFVRVRHDFNKIKWLALCNKQKLRHISLIYKNKLNQTDKIGYPKACE